MKKLLIENQIIKAIAKELQLDERTVMLVIKSFFRSLRKQLSLNNEINIKGFFKIVIANSYKKQFKKNKNYNPRKRVQYEKKIKIGIIDNNEKKDNINH
jgi:nucleoid DNA-binding protein